MNLKFAKLAIKNGITPTFFHKTRKEWGVFDLDCLELQKINPANDSVFLKIDGKIFEVKTDLLDTFEQIRQ